MYIITIISAVLSTVYDNLFRTSATTNGVSTIGMIIIIIVIIMIMIRMIVTSMLIVIVVILLVLLIVPYGQFSN